ncbi:MULTISPECIES: hypothetical protein [Kitasatospora]|uniref:hypothetical protein n=1 Tax=Kitasatospora TaxID=2063 RepID=UPI0031D0A640
MEPQPAAVVGVLGPLEQPRRLLVVWGDHRAVTAELDQEQARAIAERLPGHLVTARDGRVPDQVVRWLQPPLDVTLHLHEDGAPHFAHLDLP